MNYKDMGFRLVYISAFAFLLMGCQREGGKERYHPDKSLLPSLEVFDHIFHLDREKSKDSLEAIKSWLQAMRPRWQLGALVGDKAEMFGEIADVEKDSRGRIFVLDRDNAEIRVFDSTGAYLFSIGTRGEGPGEFIYPEWIALDAGDTLFVATRRKIEVFAPEKSRYVYYRTIVPLPIVPSGGLCVEDSILFVSGHVARKDAPFIYKMNVNGYILDTLGSVIYNSDNRLVWNYITKNYMACDFDRKIVTVAFRYIPIIQTYHMKSGQLLWQAWIDGVNIEGFVETKDGAIYFPNKTPDNVLVLFRKIFNIYNGIFILQYMSIKDVIEMIGVVYDYASNYVIIRNDNPLLYVNVNTRSKIMIDTKKEFPNIVYFER